MPGPHTREVAPHRRQVCVGENSTNVFRKRRQHPRKPTASNGQEQAWTCGGGVGLTCRAGRQVTRAARSRGGQVTRDGRWWWRVMGEGMRVVAGHGWPQGPAARLDKVAACRYTGGWRWPTATPTRPRSSRHVPICAASPNRASAAIRTTRRKAMRIVYETEPCDCPCGECPCGCGCCG